MRITLLEVVYTCVCFETEYYCGIYSTCLLKWTGISGSDINGW